MGYTKLEGNLIGKMGWEMDINGHPFITDATEEVGGENRGPSPKILLLAGLIGCTGVDVRMILHKMKVELSDMKISAEADSSDDHPKIYTKIHLTYTFFGEDLSLEKLERAVKLSKDRYCGVSAMLSKAADITYEIIVKEREA